MPQTIEAIQHAKAAGVPIVVALNKIDKPEADPEKVKQELTKYGVIPEEWGGENIFVNVSARTGQGVDQLLESVLLQAEVLELKAPTAGLAAGYVIESSLEKGRGAVATVLVLRGTLKLGDPLLIGQEFGRVRALFDEAGQPVDAAGPSIPVVVLGLSGAPNAGDELLVVESERKAREVATHRQAKSRDVKLAQKSANMQDVFSTMGENKADLVQLLVKADVQGSVEALRDALNALSTGEVAVNIVASGVGGLTESDVTLAAPPRHASLRSMCAAMPPPAPPSRITASMSATTASFTKPSMTSRPCSRACCRPRSRSRSWGSRRFAACSARA